MEEEFWHVEIGKTFYIFIWGIGNIHAKKINSKQVQDTETSKIYNVTIKTTLCSMD